jgi:hypothetical protein
MSEATDVSLSGTTAWFAKGGSTTVTIWVTGASQMRDDILAEAVGPVAGTDHGDRPRPQHRLNRGAIFPRDIAAYNAPPIQPV